jgi:hypothetical protein
MNYKEATDAMYAIANETAKSYQAIIGYVPQIIWNNVGPQTPPDGSKIWLRVGRTTVHEGQAALAVECGDAGQQLFDTDGLLWVQFFLPQADPKSATVGQQIVEMMRDSFRRKRSDGLVFRNSRFVEVAPENETVRFNVVAEFHYTQVQ